MLPDSIDKILGRYVGTEIDHSKACALGIVYEDVLAKIVQIACHGANHYSSCCLHCPSLHQGRQDVHRFLGYLTCIHQFSQIPLPVLKPLAHRLEYVGKFGGIEFYNDSLPTIPEATIAAINTLERKLQTIILGGHETEQKFEGLARIILKSKIKNIIFFPPTGKRIWQTILKENKDSKELIKPYFVNNMKEAVLVAFKQTIKGGICVLSCACPSFGVFENYKQRGNLFKKYVKLYGKKET